MTNSFAAPVARLPSLEAHSGGGACHVTDRCARGAAFSAGRPLTGVRNRCGVGWKDAGSGSHLNGTAAHPIRTHTCTFLQGLLPLFACVLFFGMNSDKLVLLHAGFLLALGLGGQMRVQEVQRVQEHVKSQQRLLGHMSTCFHRHRLSQFCLFLLKCLSLHSELGPESDFFLPFSGFQVKADLKLMRLKIPHQKKSDFKLIMLTLFAESRFFPQLSEIKLSLNWEFQL